MTGHQDPIHEYRQRLEWEREVQDSERRRLDLERARLDTRYAARTRRLSLWATVLGSLSPLVATATLAFTILREDKARDAEQRRSALDRFQAQVRVLATSPAVIDRMVALQTLRELGKDSVWRRDYVIALARHANDEADEQLLITVRQDLLASRPDTALLRLIAAQNRVLVDSIEQVKMARTSGAGSTVDSVNTRRLRVLTDRLLWNARTLVAVIDSVRVVSGVTFDRTSFGGSVSGIPSPGRRMEFPARPILRGVKFVNSSFYLADLRRVVFDSVTFEHASLTMANVSDARFYDVVADSLTALHFTTEVKEPQPQEVPATLVGGRYFAHSLTPEYREPPLLRIVGSEIIPSSSDVVAREDSIPTGRRVCALNYRAFVHANQFGRLALVGLGELMGMDLSGRYERLSEWVPGDCERPTVDAVNVLIGAGTRPKQN
jgi:hypothetical protein